jgi:hypothetical protein
LDHHKMILYETICYRLVIEGRHDPRETE